MTLFLKMEIYRCLRFVCVASIIAKQPVRNRATCRNNGGTGVPLLDVPFKRYFIDFMGLRRIDTLSRRIDISRETIAPSNNNSQKIDPSSTRGGDSAFRCNFCLGTRERKSRRGEFFQKRGADLSRETSNSDFGRTTITARIIARHLPLILLRHALHLQLGHADALKFSEQRAFDFHRSRGTKREMRNSKIVRAANS